MASTFPPDPDEIDAPDEASAPEAAVDPHEIGTIVPWDGRSPATAALAALLGTVAPEGTLRLVIQRLALHEHGERRGTRHVADAITDVGGNLVVIPLRERVLAEPALAERLTAAMDRLQADVDAELHLPGGAGADSLEVVLDADGERRVTLGLGIEVTPQEADALPPHPAVHDGAHHIAYDAPALDELRDRLRPPEPGLLARLWARLRER